MFLETSKIPVWLQDSIWKKFMMFFEEFMNLCDWLRVIQMLINEGNSAHSEVGFFCVSVCVN